MPKKSKKNQNNDSKFNVDNEIIIGIKTLPKIEPENKKVKKTKKNKNKVVQNKTTKKTKVQAEKKPQKNNKNSKRKAHNVNIVKWATICILLIGSTIYFMLSPFFNIKKIEVTGNKILTSEQVISLSQIQLEENTFKLIKNKIKKNIKQNAYVENVNIKRKLPSTIEIEIEERTSKYIIAFANAYAYINNQGYFLEVSKEKPKLPIITGYSTKQEEIYEGGRLSLEDLQKLDNVLQIMKSAESNEIDQLVTKINISDKQNYILELSSQKKTVQLGDISNLSTKMLYIKSILEQNKNIEGEILVNTDLNSKGAIFRKKV